MNGVEVARVAGVGRVHVVRELVPLVAVMWMSSSTGMTVVDLPR